MAYLTVDQWKTRTIMAPNEVTMLESKRPGFVAATIETVSCEIDDQLRNRYDVPFGGADPTNLCPRTVQGWVEKIVTRRAYMALGFPPEGQQDGQVVKDHDEATAAITEAADPTKPNRWNLPVRSDTKMSGVVFGTPQGYAEPDPYSWQDAQAEATYGR